MHEALRLANALEFVEQRRISLADVWLYGDESHTLHEWMRSMITTFEPPLDRSVLM